MDFRDVQLILAVDAGKKGNFELKIKHGQDPEVAVQLFCMAHHLSDKALSQLTEAVKAKLHRQPGRLLGRTAALLTDATGVFKRLHYRSIVDANILHQKLAKSKQRRERKLSLELTFSPRVSTDRLSKCHSPRSVYSLHSRMPSFETERLRHKLLRRQQRACTFTPKTNRKVYPTTLTSRSPLSTNPSHERLFRDASIRAVRLEKERSRW